MTDKQDVIVSLLKEIDKNVENLGVGGGNTPTSISGGYPVVTVEDDFNIEAEPNTFYNIKNDADSEISIYFKNGFSLDNKRKHIMFTAGNITSSNLEDIVWQLFETFGGVLVDDMSVDGYKYRMDFDSNVISEGEMSGVLPVYFSDEIKSGGSVEYYVKQDPSLNINQDTITRMDNINILNDGIDYLIMINVQGTLLPHIAIEETNDKEEYNHKYVMIGAYGDWVDALYTIEPYYLASNFYTSDGTDMSQYYAFQILPNIGIQASTIANEFVFNVSSPANIAFSETIRWHNDNIPDLTKEGIYTISIVNSVGCYTFVNN